MGCVQRILYLSKKVDQKEYNCMNILDILRTNTIRDVAPLWQHGIKNTQPSLDSNLEVT